MSIQANKENDKVIEISQLLTQKALAKE